MAQDLFLIMISCLRFKMVYIFLMGHVENFALCLQLTISQPFARYFI